MGLYKKHWTKEEITRWLVRELDEIDQQFERGELNGEHADIETRNAFEIARELERQLEDEG